jgi:hypothetical protein
MRMHEFLDAVNYAVTPVNRNWGFVVSQKRISDVFIMCKIIQVFIFPLL